MRDWVDGYYCDWKEHFAAAWVSFISGSLDYSSISTLAILLGNFGKRCQKGWIHKHLTFLFPVLGYYNFQFAQVFPMLGDIFYLKL